MGVDFELTEAVVVKRAPNLALDPAVFVNRLPN